MTKAMKMMDGNHAAAEASYTYSEVAAIYPITPSSPMAEQVDEWAAKGKKNIFEQEIKVVSMQSEAGAAGAVHGSLAAGALTTTYTASQGLLLMIPNMYKIAGELQPGVFHVSARALAAHALSIFGDHQDVMATRQTGFALLAASNVQEVMDLGNIAHLAAIKSRIPFLHFFDGFRTSHEYQKVEVISKDDVRDLIDYNSIKEFRERALNPDHPTLRGTAQNPDIYFQGREASNKFYQQVPAIVDNYMRDIERITGRAYHPFDYYGAQDAENIIIAMGSVCDTIDETIDYLTGKGEKVGLIKVRLYRPFSAEHFFNVLPASTKKIAVLDRTKEPGALGEPLYLDICNLFYNHAEKPIIVGGRYGLGSKDTRPSQIIAVYDNLKQDQPKNGFTIGIVDDVTQTSLPEGDVIETTPEGTFSCKFWGLGSDGTVGANKMAVQIVGENTELYPQAYFSYDSKKSGGSTVSHLRFGKKPIKSPYLVYNADYIACHNKSFLYNLDVLKGLKKGGTFVLNCPWDEGELNDKLPARFKRYIAQNEINFYIIDAVTIAQDLNLGNRINMIMQAAFFKLANIIPLEQAVDLMKKSVEKTYGNKGQEIVDANRASIDKGIEKLVKVNVPAEWTNIEEVEETKANDLPKFVTDIQFPMARHEGDELPVSAFSGREDGSFPLGTTAYEKRGIAVMIPEWQTDKCIQCNQCAYICPHAVVRPFLLDEEEKKRAPETFETKKAIGKGLENLEYRIQISPLDCTGCGNCADICPAPGKALVMKPAEEETRDEADNWNFAMTLTDKEGIMDPNTVKGSQFLRPLMEFSGACPGCGETPYIKLLTQLFGDRMMIANATGCSSIWGGSAPSVPYTINVSGKGPAWGNSLFEDNAEYGYGMLLGVKQIREKIAGLMQEGINQGINEQLKEAFNEWLNGIDDGDISKKATAKILELMKNENIEANQTFKEIMDRKDYLIKKSHWLIGGDGWAYDIGFGGVDQVLSTGDDVNIFVMDTEMYSNTGGQSSKSTPLGSVAKFASSGKKTIKKNLGMMAMSYGYVYVAQIAIGANMNQTIKAIAEAEAYKGPSIIIAYSPCISHGIKTGMGTSMAEAKKAVTTGHWQLYRYNPMLKEEGKNPFILDSKDPSQPFKDFMSGEIRYTSLMRTFPDNAQDLYDEAEKNVAERHEEYKKMAE